jgi:pyruvate,water dikinase
VSDVSHPLLPLAAAGERSLAGGKAATLATLIAEGERIPDGFVIGIDAARDLDAPTLPAQLAEALADLGAPRLAVRSSAFDEDGAEASQAGRYRSVLGVAPTPEALLAAAREVVASAEGGTIAVLVQPQIDAVSAGAAFSANPINGDDEVVVSAVAGLADGLLEGAVSGSEWIVRDERTLHLTGDAIDEALVLEIAALAHRLERRFGHPVDIEWAFDGAALHLLQCRPITALPRPPTFEIPAGSWSKDATHHPTPLKPLIASMLDWDLDSVARWAERSGFMIADLEQVALGGELYVRPVPLMGGGSGAPPPPWLMAIVSRIHPLLRRRMAAAAHTVTTEVFADAGRVWRERWRPELETRTAELRALDLTAFDDRALRQHYDDLWAFGERASDIHFDLFVPAMVALHELASLCQEQLGWSAAETLRLLSGSSHASSAPTRALQRVADAVAASPAARAELSADDTELLDRLAQADPEVEERITAWLDRYAFRTLNYDWSSPTLLERPALIATMLRAELDSATRLVDPTPFEAEARAGLPPETIPEFERRLAWARTNYPVREDNVTLTSLVPGALLRRASLEVGARLAARGAIATAEDVFMLTFDETIGTLLEGGGNLQELVRRRRAEHMWVITHPGPASYGEPDDGPPPDLRGLPEAGRRINGALLWTMAAEFTPIPTSESDDDTTVRGLPGAAGSYTGTARIVRSEADFGRVALGDVVICAVTNPAWTVLFGVAGAFVCDAGGPLSHTAILAREYAIPSVLATGDATRRIADGDTVTVDGGAGTVTLA